MGEGGFSKSSEMTRPDNYKRLLMFKTNQLIQKNWTVTTNLLTIDNWRVFNARSTEKTIKSSRQDQLEKTIKSSRQDQMEKKQYKINWKILLKVQYHQLKDN